MLLPRSAFVTFFGLATAASFVSNDVTNESESAAGTGYSEYVTETILYTELQASPPDVSKESEHLVKQYGVQRIKEPTFERNNENSEQFTTTYPYPHPPSIARHSETDQKVADFIKQIFKLQSGSTAHYPNFISRRNNAESSISSGDAKYQTSNPHLRSTTSFPKSSPDNIKQLKISTDLLPPIELNEYSEPKNVTNIFPGIETHVSNIMQISDSKTDSKNTAHNEDITEGPVQNTKEEIYIMSEVAPHKVQQNITHKEMNALENIKHNLQLNIKNNDDKYHHTTLSSEKAQSEQSKVLTLSSIRPSDQLYTNAPITIFPLENVLSTNIDSVSNEYLKNTEVKANTQAKAPEEEITEILDKHSTFIRCTSLEKKVPVAMVVDSFNEHGPSHAIIKHIPDGELPVGMKLNSTEVNTNLVAEEQVFDWTDNSNVTSSPRLEQETISVKTKKLMKDSSLLSLEEKYNNSDVRHTVTDVLESLSKSPSVKNNQSNLSTEHHLLDEQRDVNGQQYNVTTVAANSVVNTGITNMNLSIEHLDDIELMMESAPTTELKTHYPNNDKIATTISSPRSIVLNEPHLLLIRDLIDENYDVKTPQYHTTTPANTHIHIEVDSISENTDLTTEYFNGVIITANPEIEATIISDSSPTTKFMQEDYTESDETTTSITTSLSETIVQSDKHNQPNQSLIRDEIDETSNRQYSPITPENTILNEESTTVPYTDPPSTEYFEFTTPPQENETETDTHSSSKLISNNSTNSEDTYLSNDGNSRITNLPEIIPSVQHIEPNLLLISDLIDEITEQPYSAGTSYNIGFESTSINIDSYTENSDLTLHETTTNLPLTINSNEKYSQPDFVATQNLPIEGYVGINEESTAGEINTTNFEYLDFSSNSSLENERETQASTPTESRNFEESIIEGDITALKHLSEMTTDSGGYEYMHSTTVKNFNTDRYYSDGEEDETNYFNNSSDVKSIVESKNSTSLKQTESLELPVTMSIDFVEEKSRNNLDKIVPSNERKLNLIPKVQNVKNFTNTEYSSNIRPTSYNPQTVAYTINNDKDPKTTEKDREIRNNPIQTGDIKAELNHRSPYYSFNNRQYERPLNIPVPIVYDEVKIRKAHNKPTIETPRKVLDLATPLNNEATIQSRPKFAKHIRGNIKYIDTVSHSFHQFPASKKDNGKKSKILTSEESTTMSNVNNQISQNKIIMKYKSPQNLNISRQRGNRKYYNNKNVVKSISSHDNAKTKNGELSDDLKTINDQNVLKYTDDLLNASRQVFLETSFKISEQNKEYNRQPNLFNNNSIVEGLNSISTVSNLQQNITKELSNFNLVQNNQSTIEYNSTSKKQVEETKSLEPSHETINIKPEMSTISIFNVRSSKNAGFINNNLQKEGTIQIAGQLRNNGKIKKTENKEFDLTESATLDELVTAASAPLETIVMPYFIANPKIRQRSRLPRSSIRSRDKINAINTTSTMEATPQIRNNATSTKTSGAVKNITDKYNTKSRNRTRDPVIPILNSDNRVYAHNGHFVYSYESGDGSRAFESGELKKTDDTHAGEAVKGGFSFMDKDGQQFSVEYTADENGYRPRGAHLPTPPPVPPAIARALAYVAARRASQPPATSDQLT